ncbi:MAG TPA: choice-of-anchor L domain-containing protein [Lentimicrobium sp.]|nr:choice-of-anchor L domain-containing protein [Lentimicrobium sp.]
MKARLLFLVVALFSLTSIAQTGLQVQYSSNLDSLVYYFIETGVTFNNVTSIGHTRALGKFYGGTGAQLGIEKGIVLSTGDVKATAGQSNYNANTSNNSPGDDDLEALLDGVATGDASVLEFDLIPIGNTLAFNYVFGSEEYPEWVGSPYNDAFAYFITGPDPAGGYYENLNLAIIPGTNMMVNINNINQITNSQYYISEFSEFITYDGRTVVLPIEISVIPNEVYHLKIVIADCSDRTLDSGVFLESPSLKSFMKDVTEPFAEAGAEWYYTLTENSELIGYKTISYLSDTLINDKICSKMIEQDYEQSLSSQVFHYMYQRNDSVYFYKEGDFHLLYDFGAEAGDTITLGYYTTHTGEPLKMIIDSTATIDVSGMPTRVQYIRCNDGVVIDFGNQVIEGIGSTNFMFPTLDMSKDGPLRCYSDNNTATFHNPFYYGTVWSEDCDQIIVSIFEHETVNFRIYPNPTRESIRINGLTASTMYKMFSTSGILIRQGLIAPSENISTKNLKPGIYFIEIEGTTQKIVLE